MQRAVDIGVLNFYASRLNSKGKDGFRFREFIDKPDIKPAHMPWMEIQQAEKKRDYVLRYSSYMVKRNIGTMSEFEIMESAATIYDIMHDNDIINAYFTKTIVHKAVVKSVEGKYVQLDVKVKNRMIS